MKKAIKRLGLGLLGLLGAGLLALVILPFVIDVDSYRPQLVKLANEHINGRLEMGKLTLSLWGQVRIQVDGFSLADVKGRKVVAAKDVFFHVPLLPVLSGQPVLTFKMKRPELFVVKDRTGKLNVLTLAKASKPAPEAAPSAGEKGRAVPGMVARARLGVEMQQAHLSYKDEATALLSELRDLNVSIKDISLSKPMLLELSASLNTRLGKSLTVNGPLKVTGQVQPQFSGTEFQNASVKLAVDGNGIAIAMPDLFEKKPGVETSARVELTASPQAVKLENLGLQFFNVAITGKGTVAGLDASPQFDLSFRSNDISLKPWSDLVPMLKSYELGGTAKLAAELKGTSAAPQYQADLSFQEITAKSPGLKAQPRVEGQVKIATDRVESLLLSLKAPGNDLKITGKVASFTKPQAEFLVTSTGLDLDSLIDFPKPPPKGTTASEDRKAAPPKAEAKDFDKLLDPLRENAVLAQTSARLRANITQVKMYGIRMSDIVAVLSFRDLKMALEQFRMGLWGGTIQSSFSSELRPRVPTYRFNAEVAGLDMQQAVASQLELFKNTVLGKATFKMEGGGASFNPEPAKVNLMAKGSVKVENAIFTTIDVGRMAAEAINKTLTDLSAKLPALKGKSIPALKTDTRYEAITCDFAIAAGKFSAPNFLAKAQAGKGIDIAGSTTVGLKDSALAASWDLIDTYNLTKARDVSVDVNGVRIEHILADGSNPVRFPVRIGGTTAQPATDYGATPEALGKVALNNVGRAVESKAKAELQKKVAEEAAKVKAPPAVQNAIKDFGKKLFGK